MASLLRASPRNLTDTVVIDTQGEDVASLKSALESEDRVQRSDVLRGPGGVAPQIRVISFDIFFAESLMQLFGADRCRAEAPTNQRIIELPRGFEFDDDNVMRQVSAVWVIEEDQNRFAVQFWDSRNAAYWRDDCRPIFLPAAAWADMASDSDDEDNPVREWLSAPGHYPGAAAADNNQEQAWRKIRGTRGGKRKSDKDRDQEKSNRAAAAERTRLRRSESTLSAGLKSFR